MIFPGAARKNNRMYLLEAIDDDDASRLWNLVFQVIGQPQEETTPDDTDLLGTALSVKSWRCARVLLRAGVDPNVLPRNERNIGRYVAQFDDLNGLKELESYGWDKTCHTGRSCDHPIYIAAAYGSPETVTWLLPALDTKTDTPVEQKVKNLLLEAAQTDNVETFRVVLDWSVDRRLPLESSLLEDVARHAAADCFACALPYSQRRRSEMRDIEKALKWGIENVGTATDTAKRQRGCRIVEQIFDAVSDSADLMRHPQHGLKPHTSYLYWATALKANNVLDLYEAWVGPVSQEDHAHLMQAVVDYGNVGMFYDLVDRGIDPLSVDNLLETVRQSHRCRNLVEPVQQYLETLGVRESSSAAVPADDDADALTPGHGAQPF